MAEDRTRADRAVDRAGATTPAERSGAAEIARFLERADAVAPTADRPRLVFALDATMSRQPTWDMASRLQAEMFDEAAASGLAVSLVYFRGFAECRASRWVADADTLKDLMSRIDCRSGHTQIGRVLAHAAEAARQGRIAALVYVGDAMEEPEDTIAARAGELGLLGVKAFLFQEGDDSTVGRVYGEIARLTGGASFAFRPGAASRLGELLRAVAAYASRGIAGLEALEARGGEGARLLLGALGGADGGTRR